MFLECFVPKDSEGGLEESGEESDGENGPSVGEGVGDRVLYIGDQGREKQRHHRHWSNR